MIKWLKWKIAGEDLRELFELRMRMADVWRWCAEFEQMCDGIEYVRDNTKREHIEAFRERMRQKWGRPPWESSSPNNTPQRMARPSAGATYAGGDGSQSESKEV